MDALAHATDVQLGSLAKPRALHRSFALLKNAKTCSNGDLRCQTEVVGRPTVTA